MRTSATIVESKICSVCVESKPLEDFGLSGRHKDGRRPDCKECRSTVSKAEYASLSPERKKSKSLRTAELKQQRQRWVLDYLRSHPCVDCGESDPVVLEFDHVRGDKVMAIADLIERHPVLPALETEIAKCEVVCANCHRRRTSMRGDHFRGRVNREN